MRFENNCLLLNLLSRVFCCCSVALLATYGVKAQAEQTAATSKPNQNAVVYLMLVDLFELLRVCTRMCLRVSKSKTKQGWELDCCEFGDLP